MDAEANTTPPSGPSPAGGLVVDGLSVGYRTDGERGTTQVLRNVDLALEPGRIRGLVGESGCGKSTLALSAIGYRPRGAVILGGRSLLGDRDLLTLDAKQLQDVWGRDVAYLAQNAATALNPALTIRRHFYDVLDRHLKLSSREATARALEMLEAVRLPDPAGALRRYPHEFSGGQQQRISLALALSCRPRVVVLDEPTTGLDVTTQTQISELLTGLVGELGIAALYVSHDIALLATLASEISVMYAGEIVESGATVELAQGARHPYTRALLASIPSARAAKVVAGIPGEPPTEVSHVSCSYAPRCRFAAPVCVSGAPPVRLLGATHVVRCARLDEIGEAAAAATVVRAPASNAERVDHDLLAVRGVSCYYGRADRRLAAVRHVSFEIGPSQALGIVGLSGSGKSTLLRAIVGLHASMDGEIVFRGAALAPDARRRPRAVRRDIQIVFQDPGSSLNPRHRVGDLIARPLKLFSGELDRRARAERVGELMERVRLPLRLIDRYPGELSGGQQQRVAVARAFSTAPALLLCDEITSSLDVSVQAAIIELVRELAEENGTAVVFVSHDLAVVRSVADRTMVMLHGEVCEEGPTELLFERPQHPYTSELLSAIPDVADVLGGTGGLGSPARGSENELV